MSSRSPPSHTAAPMMCRMSAIIASWWKASSPECPCVPIGTSEATATRATRSVPTQDRTANVRTVRAAPATVVISHVLPTSSSTRNRPSWAPNWGPASMAGLNTLRSVRNPVAPAATVNRAAEIDAVSRATSNSRSPARSVNKAVTSTPTMPAAARFTTSFVTGSPQRTTGPASPSGICAAPPPNHNAPTKAMSVTPPRIAGPATRKTRGVIPVAVGVTAVRVQWHPHPWWRESRVSGSCACFRLGQEGGAGVRGHVSPE